MGLPVMSKRPSCQWLHAHWYDRLLSLVHTRTGILLTNPSDRELTLVPKKGRPVTQCQHCRSERKKRSAHVKCDCGETDKAHHPKEKCIHLREAEERAKFGYYEDHHAEKDNAHLAAVAEEQGCCCHHGGKCTCSILKRDPDEDAAAPHGPAVKPRLEKTSSDGAITVFTNGHHKPVHRKNHAAHECGMPYKLHMPRSTDSSASSITRRSFDQLSLESNATQFQSYTHPLNAPFSTERRKSKSEQHSPKMQPLSGSYPGPGDSRFASIDFSALSQTCTNTSIHSYTTDSYASPLDMPGTTDSPFDPWSAFPSADAHVMPNNNPFGVWPTQHDHSSISQPALTTASSQTQSEIDEAPTMDEAYGYHMPSIQEDANSDLATTFVAETPPQSNRHSLPPGFFGNTDFGVLGDWQSPVNGFNSAEQIKGPQGNLGESVSDNWQMPALVNVPQRALGGGQAASRPQSRSVGSTSAPNDDIIKQLFPDLELNDSYFGATDSPRMNGDGTMIGGAKGGLTSTSYEYGPMDEDNSFTTQTWTDGSMSIPIDNYTTAYDLDQDFSNPDFSENWSQ